MTTLATNTLTLLDFAKRLDPDTGAVSTMIAELLSQTNEILTDMQWKEGNLPTGHRLTMRTGLPSVAWRKLNSGIPNSKSSTAQVDEGTGMLEAKGQIDKDLAMLNGNTSQFRLSENEAFLEAMNQEMAQTLFYGDHTLAPEEFLGLTPRYSSLTGAENGANIIDAGGVGADNCSIWLVGWGNKSVHGIFPKGSKAGLTHTPVMDGTGDGCAEVSDGNGNTYRALVDRYQWKAGLALPDWRYVVRIANIDVSALIAEAAQADLIKQMSRAIDRLPNMNGIRPVFYANRTVASFLKIQSLRQSYQAVLATDAINQFKTNFLGVPIRKVDALVNSEARVV